jgi:hypothetical protein
MKEEEEVWKSTFFMEMAFGRSLTRRSRNDRESNGGIGDNVENW